MAEEGGGGDEGFAFADDFDAHRGAEGAHFGGALFAELDAAVLQEDFGVDDVDFFVERPREQAGAEGGGEEAGIFLADLAAVGEFAGVAGFALVLRHEKAEAEGDVEIAAHRRERFGVDRGHVHGVADFAGREIVNEKLCAFDGDLGLGFVGAGAEVGRDEDILKFVEGRIGAGLGRENVEGDAAEFAAFEALGEGCFVINAAAGAVDEACARLEHFDFFVTDEMLGLGREGRVDGHVVDAGEHVVNFFDALDAEFAGLFGGHKGIVGEDSHLEGDGALGNFLTNATHADDAERLVGELCAHEGITVPLAGDEAGVGGGDLAREGEHEREGVFGGAEGVARRGIHDDAADARGGVFIDVVGAYAGADDRFEAAVAFENVGGELDAAAADGAVELGEGLFKSFAFEAGASFDLDAGGRFEEVEAFLGNDVEGDDFGHVFDAS